MAVNKTFTVLTRRSDFLALKAKGRRLRPSKWLLINYKPNDFGHVRCGWTIPRKVGKAVIRNKLKRWCRECIRRMSATRLKALGLDLNIVIINEKDADFFKRIKHAEFKEVLESGLRSLV